MPGPELIAALTEVSLQACSDVELLDVLAGWARVQAWVDAQQTRLLACTRDRLLETAVRESTDLDGNTPWNAVHRQVETEISTALRWTSRMTLDRLAVAEQLTDRLPNVLDAMTAGQLGYRHAEMICEETNTLTDRQARRVVDRLLPEASSKTVPGLRRRLRKACLQLDPDTANERAARAVTERSVTIRPLTDGLALLQAIGPATAILGMFRVLDETADQHPKDDPRTHTARRFDALTHFVLTGPQHPTASTAGSPTGPAADNTTGVATGPGAEFPAGPAADVRGGTPSCPAPPPIPALVQITMDLPTLLGLQNNPADLHGYGPLPATLARTLATDADWQRFIADPITGAPRDLGRTRRHPDAALRRWIIARDRTCLFPHCYRPATDGEPDHNPTWAAGGRTDKDGLNQLCPKHHKVHHHGWHYQRHPDRIHWTSPHGQRYERHLTEADLIGPADSYPHRDDTPDDTIWPPGDEDQRLHIFLGKPRPGQHWDPDDEIPWDIVQAFRLEDTEHTWPLDEHGNLIEELVLTPEQEQTLIDQHHFRLYGSNQPPPPPENPTYQPNPPRHTKQPTHQTLPDKPPF